MFCMIMMVMYRVLQLIYVGPRPSSKIVLYTTTTILFLDYFSDNSFVMSLPDVSSSPSDIVCNVERKRINELTEAANGYHVGDATVDSSTHKGNGHCSTGITSNGYPKDFGNLDRMQRGLGKCILACGFYCNALLHPSPSMIINSFFIA